MRCFRSRVSPFSVSNKRVTAVTGSARVPGVDMRADFLPREELSYVSRKKHE